MWSGSIASIPSGWLLCNGVTVNGVTPPDLRDRFVIGAGNAYAVAATGGSANAVIVAHDHTATSTVTDEGHFHTVQTRDAGASSPTYLGETNNAGGIGTYNTDTKTTGITVETTIASNGENGAGKNLPPYYALAFIMKV